MGEHDLTTGADITQMDDVNPTPQAIPAGQFSLAVGTKRTTPGTLCSFTRMSPSHYEERVRFRENAALEPITARPIPPTLVNGVAGIADGSASLHETLWAHHKPGPLALCPFRGHQGPRSSRCHTICAGLFLCGRSPTCVGGEAYPIPKNSPVSARPVITAQGSPLL